MINRLFLGLILLAYIALGTAYAVKTPTWQAPDEPAHFNYTRDLAQGQGFPVLKKGDFNIEYLEAIKAAKFPNSMPIDPIRYESHQPPLYYLLSAPILRLGSSLPLSQQVILLRFFSVFLGTCLLLVSYLTAKAVFGDGLLALSVPAFMAFIPQHVAMTAAINNDILAELVLSSIILALVYRIGSSSPVKPVSLSSGAGSQFQRSSHETLLVNNVEKPRRYLRFCLLLGLLLGAALLTKWVTYISLFLVPVGLLAASPRAESWGRRFAIAAFESSIIYVVALVVSGWWFVRNAVVYGNLDLLGSKAHDAVVVGQQLTGTFDLAKAQYMTEVMFRSFWAQFGWMGVPADTRTYTVVGIITLASVLGFGAFLIKVAWRPNLLVREQWLSLGLLVLAFCMVFTGVLQYNLQYLQPQGRYLFPVLLPIATFSCIGIKQWIPARFAPVMMGLVFLGMSFLSAYSLVRFVIPWLS